MEMDSRNVAALDRIEALANQAMNDYRTLGWTAEASEVDTLLDAVLSAVGDLDRHFTGLGLSLDLAGDSETLD